MDALRVSVQTRSKHINSFWPRSLVFLPFFVVSVFLFALFVLTKLSELPHKFPIFLNERLRLGDWMGLCGNTPPLLTMYSEPVE